MADAYTKLIERIKNVYRLDTIAALLDWDQETQMPKNGVSARAEQIGLIASLAHKELVADETRSLLEAAKGDGSHVAETNLREIRWKFDRAAKIPSELVREIAETTTHAKHVWAKARADKNFAAFAPLLSRIVDLKRQVAERIGYETEAYDALMDEYEPGAKAAEIEKLFADLVGETRPLLEKLMASPNKPDPSILTRHYPRAPQERLSRKMAETVHFDFGSGRTDVSVHPFCTTIGGPKDVRITTRYLEDFLPGAIFGTLHECGHALYEQGLLDEHRFTPMGEYVSLGIHESQSRMWENLVGRSRAFWECHFADVKAAFPEALGDVSLDQFYGAINTVQPSFIRVEADELTYNLHIVVRFEIERALINGSLAVRDIPEIWNEKFSRYLGITPPDDAQGSLQDIHWSMGAIGYFATYALGNLYATQFFAQARKDIPDLDDRVRANDHRPLLGWLRENIHHHGRRYRANELIEKVTGKPLSIEPYMEYVSEKFGSVYDV
jgi:carboxypeptidase Taq